MPINTDLNVAPYFDDFDAENQFYRVLFKPGYAVQARELTQLQTILQQQVESFGDNIFKEGSIVKGCTFTNLNDLEYVKLTDRPASETDTFFDPELYISKTVIGEGVGGVQTEIDEVYVVVGLQSGLSAQIIDADRGFQTRPPNLNTFFIRYLNSTSSEKSFRSGETLRIDKYQYKTGTVEPVSGTVQGIDTIEVTTKDPLPTGKSFGISVAPGIIFQKGNFIFVDEQKLVVEKYSRTPVDQSVGFEIQESLVTFLQDASLYDNANGYRNENAPGADRLKLVPILTKKLASDVGADSSFFTLIRYQNGNAVSIRDVSQYNVLGDVTAKRTYEESGNYILREFDVNVDRNFSRWNYIADIADVNVVGDPQLTLNANFPSASKLDAVEDVATGDLWVYDGNKWNKLVLQAQVGPGVAYVKGYRVESVGTQSFEIEPTTNTEIQTSQPFSFNYGNYVDVTGFSGYLDIDISSTQDLLDSGDVKIGECFISNLTSSRAYIWGISLNVGKDFSDVAKIDGATTGEITVGNVLKGTDKRSLIFDTGMNYLFDATEVIVPIRGQTTETVNSNEFTLTAGPGTDFALTQNNILVITATGTQVNVTNTSTQLNNSRLTVSLQPGVVSDGQQVICYYDYRAIESEPRNKIERTPYVKLDHVTTRTQFTLGFPDVFDILSIVDSTGTDYTKSFRLNPNQKDQFYDLSFIEYIQGRPRPGNEQLTIQLRVFETNVPVGSESFYSINSYPTSLNANDIPVYISESGRKFNLRDCFDFRPQVDKVATMSYTANTPASAPVINSTILGQVDAQAPSFTGTYTLPAVEQFSQADIEYYLPRYDIITIDSYGKFSYVKGLEERDPSPTQVGSELLVISEIFVPGAPALSPKEATTQGKREYAVKSKPKGVKRYTMKDIQSIEQKIDRLVYYTSLNQLEQETNNLTILDENGLSRFKNGFIADPFNNLTLANVTDPKFDAAVHFNQRIMTPSVRTFDLNLKYKTASSATIYPPTTTPNIASLSRNAHVSIINQPYATGFRNCVSNFYKYNGSAEISPEFDATYDTTTNPVEINFEDAFTDFTDNLQRFIPLTDAVTTNESQLTNEFARARANGGTVTFQETTSSLFQSGTNVQQVGDFVTNFQFKPYMSARDIRIFITGLKPNTQHYFFFDKQDVNSDVCPGTTANSAQQVQRNGEFGSAVSSDANGILRAVFRLPGESFFVGEKQLEVADVDTYAEISSGSTSTGQTVYRAYNFDIEKAGLSTRMPEFDITSTTTNRSVTFRSPPDNDDGGGGDGSGNDGGNSDPLAQTFFIKRGMGRGSNTVAVSKLDLYFKRKATSTVEIGGQSGGINGVTVMLREVINGYPSSTIIPFSKVHLEASDVNISDDASVATTIDFHAPIILETEREYALVVQPDADDPGYLIFTSQVGGNDLTPGATQGQPIVQDWGDGVLFTSTNNRAWKSYQDEDVKFTLYRHDFNASEGSVTLTNDDHEFFTVTDITAPFNRGELVYQDSGTSQSVGMALANTTITRVGGSNFDTVYAIGDFVKLESGGVTEIFEIISVTPDAMEANKPAGSNFSSATATPVVAGTLCYYNVIEPEIMYLEGSSARSTKLFTTGSTITGVDSGATAEIVSIDDIEISYAQPFISRVNDSVTQTKISGTFIPPLDIGTTYNMPMKFNGNNSFNKSGVLLYSKTNNLSGSLLFEITIDMSNGGNSTSTPLIDIETSKLLAYKYNITNTPDQTSNFISKVVELAEDFDAEDFNLILTAHKPIGTEIKTYIRAQNIFDSVAFDEVPWVEMELFEGIEQFSSSTNLNDYREYRYRIATADKDGSGVYTYTSRAGQFKTFRKFAVRIEMLAPTSYDVPKIKDYRGIALT